MNWVSPMIRMKAYRRTAYEALLDRDYEAAGIALTMIKKLCDETAEAMVAEEKRLRELEQK